MTRIFISYSRVDAQITKELADLLNLAFDGVWYDTKLTGGDDWWAKIKEEIQRCDHFIYLISTESVNSEWCKKELGIAQKQGKHIIPVQVRDRTPLPKNLKNTHCINMFGQITVDGLNQIYAAIIRHPNTFELQGENVSDVKQNENDLNLLLQLWKYIQTPAIQELADIGITSVHGQTLFWIYDVYLNQLRDMPENHFHNLSLEAAFVAFDQALRDFADYVDGYSSGDRFVQFHVERSAYTHQELGDIYDRLEKIRYELRHKQKDLIDAIKKFYPDFQFHVDFDYHQG